MVSDLRQIVQSRQDQVELSFSFGRYRRVYFAAAAVLRGATTKDVGPRLSRAGTTVQVRELTRNL
jgi:hypothetical protein